MSKTERGNEPQDPPPAACPAPLAYRAPHQEPPRVYAGDVVRGAFAIMVGLVMLLVALGVGATAVSEAVLGGDGGVILRGIWAALAASCVYFCFRSARNYLTGEYHCRRARERRREPRPVVPAEAYDDKGSPT